MFARVTYSHGTTDKDKIVEGTKIFKDSIVPAARAQKGYRGLYLLSNSKTGKRITISFWDTEEDAIANERSGYYQQQRDKIKDFVAALPIREGYEVTVQD